MKPRSSLLAIVLPCAAGWLCGSILWPPQSYPSTKQIIPATREELPPLKDVLESSVPQERMSSLARIGMRDPDALASALRAVSAETDDPAREAARALALQSPGAAWRFICAAWPDPVSRQVACGDAAAWACERAPAAGLDFLGQLAQAEPDGLGEEAAGSLVAQALKGFARQHLPVFREWLSRRPEGTLRQEVMEAILPRWIAEDYSSALAAIQGLPRDGDGGRRRIEALLHNVVRGGSGGLSLEIQKQRLEQLDDADREAVLPKWISDCARYDPDTALPLLAQLQGDALSNTAASLFGAWGERDPLRAARALGSLEESVQPAAAGALVRKWAEKNSAAASDWVATLPADPSRESAAGSLSAALAADYPRESFVWAASLTDQSARTEALRYTWRTALAHDAAGAASALNSANLPDADKQRLRAEQIH